MAPSLCEVPSVCTLAVGKLLRSLKKLEWLGRLFMVKGSSIPARNGAENVADVSARMLWSPMVKTSTRFSALYRSCNSQRRSPTYNYSLSLFKFTLAKR